MTNKIYIVLLGICFIFFNSCSNKKKVKQQDGGSSQNIVQKETTAKFGKPTITEKNDTAQSNVIHKKSDPKKAASNAVKPEKHTMVDSSTFPIIFLDVPNTNEAFATAKKWGATDVHRYAMGRSIKKNQSFFNRAADHGLKVMSNLQLSHWIKKDHGLDSVQAYVKHFKDSPALGFWYLGDEPDIKGYSPAKLATYYKMIKKRNAQSTGWRSRCLEQEMDSLWQCRRYINV
jgi:hypothetical protein